MTTLRALYALAVVAFCVSSLSSVAQAATYTFVPNPSDLRDLTHQEWYLWTFAWSVPSDEQVTEALLTFHNITNWANEPNNRLQIHLVDNPSLTGWTYLGQRTEYGSVQKTYMRGDNDNSADNFASWSNQKLVGIYCDRDGVYRGYSSSSDPDVTFAFSNLANVCYDAYGNPINIDPDPDPTNLVPTLNAWAADGNWALGIDPDCHYYNCGITLQITTAPKPPDNVIPEPCSLVLASLGLAAGGLVRRNRRR